MRFPIVVFLLLLFGLVAGFCTLQPRISESPTTPENEAGPQLSTIDSSAGLAQPQAIGLERSTLDFGNPMVGSLSVPDQGPRILVHLENSQGVGLAGAELFVLHEDWTLHAEVTNRSQQDPDFVSLARLIGSRHVADVNGEVVLPYSTKPLELVAFSEDLVGTDWIRGAYETTVILEHDTILTVQANKEDGTPASGIDVGLYPLWAEEDPLEDTSLTSRTDDTGMAILHHLAGLGYTSDKVFGVAPVGLFPDTLWPRLPLSELINQQIDLTIPPYGSVEVRFQGNSHTSAGEELQVNLGLDLFPQEGRDLSQLQDAFDHGNNVSYYRFLHEGRAIFPSVSTGLDLIAEIANADPLDSTLLAFKGPSSAGEHVVVDLRPLVETRPLELTILGPDGHPWANRTVEVLLQQQWGDRGIRSPRAKSMVTGDQGQVTFDELSAFFLARPKVPSVHIRVSSPTEAAHPDLWGSLTVDPATIDPDQSMGLLKLSVEPALISGKVRGISAENRSWVLLEIDHCADPATAMLGGWETVQIGAVQSDGAFSIPYPEQPLPGLLRISASSGPGDYRNTRFEAGSEGVLLDFTTDHEVSGRVLLPPGITPDEIRLHFYPAIGVDARASRKVSRVEEDGSFKIRELGATPGDLVIVGANASLPLQRIEQIQPRPVFSPPDPRLKLIDLRQGIYRYEILVCDAAEAIPDSGWLSVQGRRVFQWRQMELNGFLSILSASPQEEVTALASGYLLQKATLVPGASRMILEPALPTSIHVLGTELLPSKAVLAIEFDMGGKRWSRVCTEEIVFPLNEEPPPLFFPQLGNYSWSFKVWSEGEYLFGYRMSDPEDRILFHGQSRITLSLPAELIDQERSH